MQSLDRDLTNQPAVEGEARRIIGQVYEELGKYPEAEAMYRKALDLRHKAFGSEHEDVAVSLDDLADVARDQGRYPEAEATARDALTMERKLPGAEHADVATALQSLGDALELEGKYAESETDLRQCLAMRQKLLGTNDQAVTDANFPGPFYSKVLIQSDSLPNWFIGECLLQNRLLVFVYCDTLFLRN
ncbi:MAG: tetratricopeptide repeat protein [Verrucomicrobiota bacterium]